MHIRNSRKGAKIFGGMLGRQILWLSVFLVTAGSCEVIQSRPGLQKEPGEITKGPMLLRVYQNRAAVMWETNLQGAFRINYGKEGKPEKYVESEGEKVQYKISKVLQPAVERTAFIHKVWLEDLEPGAAYSYRVTGPGIESSVYKFRTVPSETDRVRFIICGDSRSQPDVHRKLVKLMIDKRVDFVVNSGDLVTSGDRYGQWGPQFFGPLSGLIETVPVYAIKGNHETGKRGNYEKLLIPPGETNNFSFDYGPVHYFCADNAVKDSNSQAIPDIIISDIKNSKARWKFVSYHRPSLNAGHHWSAWGYPEALPRLARAGVDFVITGHSHLYERFRPIAPAQEGGSYVTYITSGGGGVMTSGIKPCEYHAKAIATHHFCLFEINGNKLTMDTIGIDGKIIDHLEITKSEGRLNQQYIEKAIPMEEIVRYQKANLHREK